MNLDTEITKWLNIGLNAQFVHKGSDDIKADTGAAKAASPFGDVYEADGSIKVRPWDDNRIANPLLNRSVDEKYYRTQTFNSSVYGKLTLPFALPPATTPGLISESK